MVRRTPLNLRIPHNRLTFGEEEVQAVANVARSGHWAMGDAVASLEKTFAERVGVEYGVCVSSGLSALILSLRGLGIGKGDEVIIPAYSFVALIDAILIVGGTPVLVDVRASDWNIDPTAVRAAVTEKTKAIIVVNTFGVPAPIEEYADLGIPVVEDCAHGFAVEYNGTPIGARSTVSMLSFYATKPMGGGEGGMVLTNDKRIADTVFEQRDYENLPPSDSVMNYKMNDLEASLALVQYGRYDDMIQARYALAERYDTLLRGNTAIESVLRLPDLRSDRIWYRYAVEVADGKIDELIHHFEQHEIEAIKPVDDWRNGDYSNFPVANNAYKNTLSLPLYPSLEEQEQDKIVEAIKSYCLQPIAAL